MENSNRNNTLKRFLLMLYKIGLDLEKEEGEQNKKS